MKFWDTSAFLQLIVKQRFSDELTQLVSADRSVALWWGTRLEALSGLHRVQREGVITAKQFQAMQKNLRDLAAECFIVEPSSNVLERAERLLATHELRAADALQLAAALILFRESPSGNHFVCVDGRLAQAAHKEGFTVMPG